MQRSLVQFWQGALFFFSLPFSTFSLFALQHNAYLFHSLTSIFPLIQLPTFNPFYPNKHQETALNPMLLQVLSVAGSILGFVFLTLSIASGLYYISEIVEEHTRTTKKFLQRAIYTIVFIHILLAIFDGFPIKKTLFAILSYFIYFQNLKTFPFISLTDPIFLLSALCVLVNHYLWFNFFNQSSHIPPQFRFDPNYIPPRRASFAEVASFFTICVWFVPFALFVSLSAGDYVLPTTQQDHKKLDDDYSPTTNSSSMTTKRRRAVGLVRVVINNVRDTLTDLLGTINRSNSGSHDLHTLESYA